jgi:acyl carrier protein
VANLNNPDMTAARFVTGSAMASDEPLYRTGDRGRHCKDGVIEFLGRADSQIKVRGFRIDPEEIEITLQRHPAVQAAAVTAGAGASGASRMIAYVQPHVGHELNVQDLRRHLAAWLPDHMIPAAIATVERIPLTPSGKLDRKALLDAAHVPAAAHAPFAPPRTPVEHALAGIWRELLQVDRVGLHDNFFELGGHSLLATRVISRIREEFDLELPVRHLFVNPTIAELAISIVHDTLAVDDNMEALLSEIERMEG